MRGGTTLINLTLIKWLVVILGETLRIRTVSGFRLCVLQSAHPSFAILRRTRRNYLPSTEWGQSSRSPHYITNTVDFVVVYIYQWFYVHYIYISLKCVVLLNIHGADKISKNLREI